MFTVGQTVTVEYASHGRGHERVIAERRVAKVGKRWITLEAEYGRSHRFCHLVDDDEARSDGENDGPYHLDGGDYGSPGRVWRDAAHRDAYTAKEAAWARLTAHARERSTMPGHLTTAQLEAIADLLQGVE